MFSQAFRRQGGFDVVLHRLPLCHQLIDSRDAGEERASDLLGRFHLNLAHTFDFRPSCTPMRVRHRLSIRRIVRDADGALAVQVDVVLTIGEHRRGATV
jgi:hypothetical protein